MHCNLEAHEEALEYIEKLILKLLSTLCHYPVPRSCKEIEDRVREIFPMPIDRWLLKDQKSATEKLRKKSPLTLPVEKVHLILQNYSEKITWHMTTSIVKILEYVSYDILKVN